MGRPGKVWQRPGRPHWYATIHGRQVNLGPDHAEALKEYHRKKARAAPPTTRATVLESADRFLGEAEARVKPVTFVSYRHYLQSFCNHCGGVRATTIEPRHVQAWLEEHPGWSVSTRHTAVAIVRIWSRWALDPDPLRTVKRPKMGRRAQPPPGALEAVLAAFRSPEMRDLATVLYETGCRPGEIRALEAASVSQERSTAVVSGKTGTRLVGLSERALAVLLRNGDKYPTGPVLRNTRGHPWTAYAINDQFRRAAKRLGLGVVSAYHCRHAFWARAHKAGVGDIAIGKQMGHRSLHMLSTVYAEADAEIMREAARRASEG